MKARTMPVASGERRVAADEPKVRFTSPESFATVLCAGNRELLRGESGRITPSRITPKVMRDRGEPDLPLALSREAR